MEFNSYVKSEKQKARKERVVFFKSKTKSILDTFFSPIVDSIKEYPFLISMLVVLSSVTMPFLSMLSMMLFEGNYQLRLGVYLLSALIVIFIVEMCVEEERYGDFSWEDVGKYFLRDTSIFIAFNIVTLIYGQFILWIL